METIYVTIENQIRADGSKGLLYDHFTDKNQAYAKLYTILAAAAVSDVPYHSGHMIAYEPGGAYIVAGQVFDRREPEPEPEPEPMIPEEE